MVKMYSTLALQFKPIQPKIKIKSAWISVMLNRYSTKKLFSYRMFELEETCQKLSIFGLLMISLMLVGCWLLNGPSTTRSYRANTQCGCILLSCPEPMQLPKRITAMEGQRQPKKYNNKYNDTMRNIKLDLCQITALTTKSFYYCCSPSLLHLISNVSTDK